MLPELMRQRSHAGRYREISTVLIQHGLGGLLAPLGITIRRIGVPRGLEVAGESNATATRQQRAVHLRLAVEKLGPTFIKLGQILSTRSDIVPAEYISELVKLQDQIPASPFAGIKALVELELGAPISDRFAVFSEEPLAAASIGQVHEATLLDGRAVVVKVQRPGVVEMIDEDLAILSHLAVVAERRVAIARRLDLTGLIAEFAWTLRAELDYAREGRNAERFARIFELDPRVVIPDIHWTHSSSRVLTMERLRGIRIDDASAIVAAGLDPVDIAERAARIVLREVFQEGFFHADPHPGNFLVAGNGAIAAMDFGMVGTINDRLREQLLFLLFAVIERDTPRIVDDMILLGATSANIDRAVLERDVDHLIAQYYGRKLNEIQIGRVVSEIMALVQRNQLRLPAELALLAKTIVMSEAMGRQLDPGFQVVTVAEPFVRDAMKRYYRPEFWRSKLRMKPLEALLMTAALPGQAQRLLTRIERNQLTLHVHYDELGETIRALNAMVNRLALAVLAAAMGIGLVVLYGATGSPVRNWIAVVFALGFATTTAIAIALLIVIWRSDRG